MFSTALLFTVFVVYVTDVAAILTCVCNKDESRPLPVMNSTESSAVIGYLNPRQCRTFISKSDTNSSWLIIQINGEQGYIPNDPDDILIAECPGSGNESLPTTNITTSPNVHTNSSNGTHTCVLPHISHAFKGNVGMCPQYVVHGAKTFCHVLTQHGHNCYEVSRTRVSWTHAQQQCTERGGHLVTIHNAQENNYVHHVLTQMNVTHGVWLGLHDRVKEGHYQWVTGEKLSYTHWSNHSTHEGQRYNNIQDCAVIQVTGLWEDARCGSDNLAGETNMARHQFICEYRTHTFGGSIIG